MESREEKGKEGRALIHTGAWGTGAFGGSRVLIALLQLGAAKLAGVDLVYHVGDAVNAKKLAEALEIWKEKYDGDFKTDRFLKDMHECKFVWGISDGN